MPRDPVVHASFPWKIIPWRSSAVKYFSIITQVIIEFLALSLAENGVIFRYNHLRRGD